MDTLDFFVRNLGLAGVRVNIGQREVEFNADGVAGPLTEAEHGRLVTIPGFIHHAAIMRQRIAEPEDLGAGEALPTEGEAPPQTYGTPSWARASLTARSARLGGSGFGGGTKRAGLSTAPGSVGGSSCALATPAADATESAHRHTDMTSRRGIGRSGGARDGVESGPEWARRRCQRPRHPTTARRRLWARSSSPEVWTGVQTRHGRDREAGALRDLPQAGIRAAGFRFRGTLLANEISGGSGGGR